MIKKYTHNRGSFLFLMIMLWAIGFSFAARAQGTLVVKGVVSDKDGQVLPGVSVLDQGSRNGAVTNNDGEYTIEVQEDATLTFSFIGMAKQSIEVNGRAQIDVQMVEDFSQLSEVVVVGYGTQKRSELTGSVASIEGEALKKVPVASVAESLSGRLAGVQVTSAEGSPDSEIKIRVRGGASLTQSGDPLYIVDGFPVATITDITPSDIASIDVLKDASSTAIYGSRGANGVIILTTKSGKEGKVSVNYNSFYSVSKIANTLDVLSPKDYVDWQYEYALLNDPEDLSSYTDYFGLYQDIGLYEGLPANDWQRQVYGQVGNIFSNDLSVRGGSEKFNYSINFARFDQKAIQVGSDYLRNNISVKLKNKPSNDVDLFFSLRYSDTEINGGGANEQNEVSSADSRLKHSIGYSPIPIDGLTVTNLDNTIEETAGDLVNPLIALADNDRTQVRQNYNIGAGVSWSIFENLKFRTDVGLDRYNRNDNRFYGLTTYYVRNSVAAENQNQPAIILRDRKEIRYRNTNVLSYNWKLNDHNLSFLAGQELLLTQEEQLTSVVHGFPLLFDADQAFKLTSQGVPFSTNRFLSPDDKLLSFFTRLNYDYKGKYLFQGVYRADASSRFLGDNVWGYFPSVSAGWLTSSESFMQGTSNWLDLLKLRASYGIAGNNNIPSGQTVQVFQSSITPWINNVSSYWAPNTLVNPDLKWETTFTRNVGIDFGLLKGRLNGTLEAYNNITKDLLLFFPLEGTGYEGQFQNLGEIQNQGLEATLSAIILDKKDYGVNFNFNIAFNRNEVLSLGFREDFGENTNWASSQIGNDFFVSTGRPNGSMFGYVNDGRYEVADFEFDTETEEYSLKEGVTDIEFLDVAPGTMKLKDLDGNGVVNEEDQRFIGNANPKHTGGFVLNAYAYGFDLTAAFNWSYGNDIYNANKIEFTTSNPNSQYRNLISIQEDGQRWTNVNKETGQLVKEPSALAALNENTTMWSPYMDRYVFSDWAVEDGSFLRLNTLTLGYTLPQQLVERAGIQNLRLYATGFNVFILTDYSGFDPEVSTRRNTPLTPGVDYSAYPRSRQITFGLNLTF